MLLTRLINKPLLFPHLDVSSDAVNFNKLSMARRKKESLSSVGPISASPEGNRGCSWTPFLAPDLGTYVQWLAAIQRGVFLGLTS